MWNSSSSLTLADGNAEDIVCRSSVVFFGLSRGISTDPIEVSVNIQQPQNRRNTPYLIVHFPWRTEARRVPEIAASPS
jgi:hypothetical protein